MAPRILFLCTKNAIRSPMAEALAKDLLIRGEIAALTVDSAGVDPGDVDGFAIAIMAEIGIDLQRHASKDICEFTRSDFDLIIALSTTALNTAHRQFASDIQIEAWDIADPSLSEGNRDQRLEAYRSTRDQLIAKICQRFAL